MRWRWRANAPSGSAPPVGTVAPLGGRGARLLSDVPIFAGLSARDLRRVAGLAEETWFNPGRVVVQEGKPGSSFYAVILDGTARVPQAPAEGARGGPTAHGRPGRAGRR